MLAAYMPLLLSMLAFAVSVFSFFYFKSYIKSRVSQERILSELKEEVNSILKTINETTDRDISLIEEREKTLKALLEEIEKRLKVYIREMEVRRGIENAYKELGKNRYRFLQDPQSTPGSQGKPDPQDTAPKAKPAFPVPEFTVKAEGSPGKPPETTPPVGEQIFSLARAGFSVPAIASRLGISIAEVEFATALMEKKP